MQITLDFYGFTKEVDVSDRCYHGGILELWVAPPMTKVASELNLEADINLNTLKFYKGGDPKIWRP